MRSRAIEPVGHARAARAFLEILRRAIFARQKPLASENTDDADTFRDTHRLHIRLVIARSTKL